MTSALRPNGHLFTSLAGLPASHCVQCAVAAHYTPSVLRPVVAQELPPPSAPPGPLTLAEWAETYGGGDCIANILSEDAACGVLLTASEIRCRRDAVHCERGEHGSLQPCPAVHGRRMRGTPVR